MPRKIAESKAKYGPITGRPGQSINNGPHTVVPPLKPEKLRQAEKNVQSSPIKKSARNG